MREVLTPAAWACSSIMLAEGDLIQVFTNAQINFYVSYVMQMSDTPLTYQIPNTRWMSFQTALMFKEHRTELLARACCVCCLLHAFSRQHLYCISSGQKVSEVDYFLLCDTCKKGQERVLTSRIITRIWFHKRGTWKLKALLPFYIFKE